MLERAQPPIGIVSIGTYTPSQFMTAAEVARITGLPEQVITEKLGIRRKPIPGPDDHPNAMGIKAALDCLSRCDIPPEEIDVVLCTTEEWKEYPLWTAGIKLAYDIGARNAWALDCHQRCANNQTVFKIAKSLMLADPEINVVMIAGGYRCCDCVDYRNRNTTFLYGLSCGAAAAILRKGHPRNEVLESAILCDGSYSLDLIPLVGGTVEPATPETVGGPRTKFDAPNLEEMKRRLNEESVRNFMRVIDTALHKSGYSRADVNYLAMVHIKPSFHKRILDELGLTEEDTYYLEDYAHTGEQDQLISLKLGAQCGRLKDGDVAVLTGAGAGYAWSATVVKWGPCSM